MNLLFSMSLAGSLVLLFYLVTEPAARRFLPASWRYRLLKVSLLFFLFPYQYWKYIYKRIWKYFFPSEPPSQGPVSSIRADKVILIDIEGNFHFKNQPIILTVWGIWGILVIAFLLYRLMKYSYCMRELRQLAKLPLVSSGRQSRGLARTGVSLYVTPYTATPFTVGLFFPRIILPAYLADRQESQMIIAHEMAHVKNHDNLLKSLWLLAMLLHWYNPFIYILYHEICRVSEQVCDASVIKGLSEREKKQYQLLIIELSQKKPQLDTLLASPLSGGFKMIRERITVMNRTALCTAKMQWTVSLTAALAVLALSPISVLAYAPAPTYAFSDEQITWGWEGTTYIYPAENNSPDASNPYCPYNPFFDYGTGHDIFIAHDGQVYLLSGAGPRLEQADCRHAWQEGTLYRHKKEEDGGCTTDFYSCQHCSSCDSVQNVAYESTRRYLRCDH